MNDEVLEFCLGLIEQVVIKEPDATSLANDRNTVAILTDDQAAAATAVVDRYRAWIKRKARACAGYVSSSDLNLLRTNAVEIETYILMKRLGQDVPVEMYKDFYRREIEELLVQQKDIWESYWKRHSRINMARKRRCWRNASLTLGVEEEYQIVSTEDWDLSPDADKVLASSAAADLELGREVYKSQLEFKTAIHGDATALEKALFAARKELKDAMPVGLALVSAGTHPFSTWNAQKASETARTDLFMHDMQDVVRRLVTFGLHIHVGVEDDELRVQVMNASRSFLPMLLAISASSPFWQGRLTGLMSYRSTVFAVLPRTGIPPTFSSYHDLQSYIELLATTKSFDSYGAKDARKIWWDVRLHPEYPTIEFRACDACTSPRDAVAMAAACQALVAKLVKLIECGVEPRPQKKHITEENKWRAARYGQKARFIDDRLGREVTCHYMVAEFLDFVSEVMDDLGSERQLRHLLTIVDEGTSANNQVTEYMKTGGTAGVVQWLATQFAPA